MDRCESGATDAKYCKPIARYVVNQLSDGASATHAAIVGRHLYSHIPRRLSASRVAETPNPCSNNLLCDILAVGLPVGTVLNAGRSPHGTSCYLSSACNRA